MKRFTLYILTILFLTCGCTGVNVNKDFSLNTSTIVNNQNDETLSQPENQQQTTNQEISLNKEEPQEKEQKEELLFLFDE